MADITPQAQAATAVSTTTDMTGNHADASSPQGAEASNPQALHDELDRLLTDPSWSPEPAEQESAASIGGDPVTTTQPIAGDQPRGAQGEEGNDGRGGEEHEDEHNQDHEDNQDRDHEGEAPASSDKGKRFRFSDPSDRQFAVLRKEGVPPEEAARIAYGIGRQGQTNHDAAQTQAQAQAQAQRAVDPLAHWQQELAVVEGELARIGKDGGGLLDEQTIALIQKRGDLIADIRAEGRLREREDRARQHQARREAEARSSQQQDNVSAATQRFPLLSNEGSALRAEADKLLRLHQGSPFLDQIEAPMILAEQAAVNLARANARTRGTSFEAEFARLEQASSSAPGSGAGGAPSAKGAGLKSRVSPASGASGTRGPEIARPEGERYREVSSSLDARSQHDELERLLYG